MLSERVWKNPSEVSEPMGIKDVIMFQNEMQPLPPDRLVHGVHIFSVNLQYIVQF